MDNSVKIPIPILISIVVFSIMIGMFGVFLGTEKQYLRTSLISNEQIDINGNIRGQAYPNIIASNMRIKKGIAFNIKDHVTAFKVGEGDLTNKLEFYGTVDTSKKGVYEVRCVVRDSLGLKTVKTILVIVD